MNGNPPAHDPRPHPDERGTRTIVLLALALGACGEVASDHARIADELGHVQQAELEADAGVEWTDTAPEVIDAKDAWLRDALAHDSADGAIEWTRTAPEVVDTKDAWLRDALQGADAADLRHWVEAAPELVQADEPWGRVTLDDEDATGSTKPSLEQVADELADELEVVEEGSLDCPGPPPVHR